MLSNAGKGGILGASHKRGNRSGESQTPGPADRHKRLAVVMPTAPEPLWRGDGNAGTPADRCGQADRKSMRFTRRSGRGRRLCPAGQRRGPPGQCHAGHERRAQPCAGSRQRLCARHPLGDLPQGKQRALSTRGGALCAGGANRHLARARISHRQRAAPAHRKRVQRRLDVPWQRRLPGARRRNRPHAALRKQRQRRPGVPEPALVGNGRRGRIHPHTDAQSNAAAHAHPAHIATDNARPARIAAGDAATRPADGNAHADRSAARRRVARRRLADRRRPGAAGRAGLVSLANKKTSKVVKTFEVFSSMATAHRGQSARADGTPPHRSERRAAGASTSWARRPCPACSSAPRGPG